MTEKLEDKQLSLADLIFRLIIVVFSVLTVGIIIQTYHLSARAVNQEVERSLAQTSRLLQNLLDYRLAALQIGQDAAASSLQLQNVVRGKESEQLDQFFVDLNQKDPQNSPDFRFIEIDKKLSWFDGNNLFLGVDESALNQLIDNDFTKDSWHYKTVPTVIGKAHILIRRTAIIMSDTGQMKGCLYTAIVLNNNLSLISQLKSASNTEDIFIVNDSEIIASSVTQANLTYHEISTRITDQYFDHENKLLNLVPLKLNGIRSPLSIISIQNKANISNLQKQLLWGFLISCFSLSMLAVIVRNEIKKRVLSGLNTLMDYTRSASDKTTFSQFQGSEIVEFNHIGQKLELAFSELIEKEQSLQDLFHYALSPIIVWDCHLKIVKINPAAEQQFHYLSSNKTGQCLFSEFEQKVEANLEYVLQYGTLTDINIEVHDRVFRWNLSPLENDGVVHTIIGQGLDITSLINAEKQSRKAEVAAQASVKAKDDFLARVSHEIRTPLNGILGTTQLLKDSIASPQNKVQVDILHRSSEHLLAVLNDILDFSKIEQGKLNIEINEFRLSDVIYTLESIYRPLCEEKQVQLSIGSKVPNDQTISTDQVRLTQILFNLLSNAVKFTSKGKISAYFTLVSQSNGKTALKIAIKDSGIGILPERQLHLFEPFVQAESTTTREYGGSGLGLSIVKHLLDMLNGSIKLESHIGTGSEFTVHLPIVLVHSKPQVELKKPELTHDLFDSEVKVLLVEDNKSNAYIAKAYCMKYNLNVDWVENGISALDKLAHQSYDLIMMDNQMPMLDGIETSYRIRNHLHISTPIYAYTADAFDNTKQAFLDAGADYIITKPIKEKALHEALVHFKKNFLESSVSS